MTTPNFPSSPAVNDQYTYGGKIFRWTGTAWRQTIPSRWLFGATSDDGVNTLQVGGSASIAGTLGLGGVLNSTTGGAVIGYRFLQSSGASDLSYKLATLPVSSNGTFEHILLEGVFDNAWASTQKTSFKILASNRGALTVQYEKGGPRDSHIDFYTESDGTVSVWAVLNASHYTTLSVNVSQALGANGAPNSITLYQNPANGTPTGTLAFSTSTAVPGMQIGPTGRVLMGSNTDDGLNKLQVTGNTYLNGNVSVVGTSSFTGVVSTVKYKNIGGSNAANGGTAIFDDNGSFDPRLKLYRWQGSGSTFWHMYMRLDSSGTFNLERLATNGTTGQETESGTATNLMNITQSGNMTIPGAFNGAGTGLTGTAASLNIGGTATKATTIAVANDVANASTVFPLWATGTSTGTGATISSTKLTFTPSTGVLFATQFSGSGASLTGTGSSFTSGAANNVNSTDTRAVVDTPETRVVSGVNFDFKQNTTNGLVDGGTFNGVMTFRKYGNGSDWTGGGSTQLGFTDNANMWLRYGTSTTWGAWKQIASTADVNTLIASNATSTLAQTMWSWLGH